MDYSFEQCKQMGVSSNQLISSASAVALRVVEGYAQHCLTAAFLHWLALIDSRMTAGSQRLAAD